LDYPDAEREKAILQGAVPGVGDRLAGQVVDFVGRMRTLELKKAPSIAETIDWAHTLVALSIGTLDETAVRNTLGVVLKHASDHERAIRELRL
jgi:MoxR-like ATPase